MEGEESLNNEKPSQSKLRLAYIVCIGHRNSLLT